MIDRYPNIFSPTRNVTMTSQTSTGSRPDTGQEEKRQKVITLRMTEELKERLFDEAHAAKVSMNQYCLDKIFGPGEAGPASDAAVVE